jgi:hypothetical protein
MPVFTLPLPKEFPVFRHFLLVGILPFTLFAGTFENSQEEQDEKDRALYAAVIEGDPARFCEAIAMGADIERKLDKNCSITSTELGSLNKGQNILIIATLCDDPSMIKFILSRQKSLFDQKCSTGERAIDYARTYKKSKALEMLQNFARHNRIEQARPVHGKRRCETQQLTFRV